MEKQSGKDTKNFEQSFPSFQSIHELLKNENALEIPTMTLVNTTTTYNSYFKIIFINQLKISRSVNLQEPSSGQKVPSLFRNLRCCFSAFLPSYPLTVLSKLQRVASGITTNTCSNKTQQRQVPCAKQKQLKLESDN